MKQSHLEAEFALHLKAYRLTGFKTEYQFCDERRWRFDFAIPDPDIMLAVEIEGGTRNKSRHTSFDGFHNDCDKYNTAALMGWIVLRFDSKHVNSGVAIRTVSNFLSANQSGNE